jgi:translation initiation factor IF-2
VTLAESSEAVLLGFNVRADATARQKADQDGIDIRYYSVIYELIDDVKDAMSGKLHLNIVKPSWVSHKYVKCSVQASSVQPRVVWLWKV